MHGSPEEKFHRNASDHTRSVFRPPLDLQAHGSQRSRRPILLTPRRSTGVPNMVRGSNRHPHLVFNLLTWIKGWIWGPSCFITVIWIYFFLPEIKNRTLEEIDEMFEAKLPARKFRKYVCVGRHVTDEKFSNEDGVEYRENEKNTGATTVERVS